MEAPDLLKLRRFGLVIAVVLVTLALAGVKLESPAHVLPLGIPMTVERPDLLNIGLVLVSFYTTLRYIYFGFLVQRSPMRVRRELPNRTERTLRGSMEELNAFETKTQKEVDRYFPRIGKFKVSFEVMADGTGCHVLNFSVPRVVRVACWIENIDFLLPILANVAAIAIWAYAQRVS